MAGLNELANEILRTKANRKVNRNGTKITVEEALLIMRSRTAKNVRLCYPSKYSRQGPKRAWVLSLSWEGEKLFTTTKEEEVIKELLGIA